MVIISLVTAGIAQSVLAGDWPKSKMTTDIAVQTQYCPRDGRREFWSRVLGEDANKKGTPFGGGR